MTFELQPDSRKVPESFSDYTPEEYAQLYGTLATFFEDRAKRGCSGALDGIIPSRRLELNKRFDEITVLARFPDQKTTRELIGAATMITMGSKTMPEAIEKVQAGYLKGTDGKQSTGYRDVDEQIHKVVRFATLATGLNMQTKLRHQKK